MSRAQNIPSAGDAKPTSSEPALDHSYQPEAAADGERCGELGMDSGADLGGHTLLSRAPAPEGRRSLFRR